MEALGAPAKEEESTENTEDDWYSFERKKLGKELVNVSFFIAVILGRYCSDYHCVIWLIPIDKF